MFALVIPKPILEEEFHFSQGANEVRLYSRVSPDFVEYVLWSDRVDFAGKEKAKSARPWPRFKFKKQRGEWIPLTRPPVRFDDECRFASKQEWLDLGIRRILTTIGSATAIEVFSSLYSTIDPWEALEHDEILAVLEGFCDHPQRKSGMSLFSLC